MLHAEAWLWSSTLQCSWSSCTTMLDGWPNEYTIYRPEDETASAVNVAESR